eukprot:TRINITY_DN7029_c0_g1_i1.p1 TRINITY_DN7029_c0_g1~~TRINITY_DN7029_c0_g1_i1.p1  ORF type:complete len:939 (-),score=268.20 TRINITY_DN7029_c0_g1_i1:154-2970(-)
MELNQTPMHLDNSSNLIRTPSEECTSNLLYSQRDSSEFSSSSSSPSTSHSSSSSFDFPPVQSSSSSYNSPALQHFRKTQMNSFSGSSSNNSSPGSSPHDSPGEATGASPQFSKLSLGGRRRASSAGIRLFSRPNSPEAIQVMEGNLLQKAFPFAPASSSAPFSPKITGNFGFEDEEQNAFKPITLDAIPPIPMSENVPTHRPHATFDRIRRTTSDLAFSPLRSDEDRLANYRKLISKEDSSPVFHSPSLLKREYPFKSSPHTLFKRERSNSFHVYTKFYQEEEEKKKNLMEIISGRERAHTIGSSSDRIASPFLPSPLPPIPEYSSKSMEEDHLIKNIENDRTPMETEIYGKFEENSERRRSKSPVEVVSSSAAISVSPVQAIQSPSVSNVISSSVLHPIVLEQQTLPSVSSPSLPFIIQEDARIAITLDVAGQMRSLSGPVDEQLGWDINSLMGQNCRSLLPTSQRRSTKDVISKFIAGQGGEGYPRTLYSHLAIQHKDRHVFPMSVQLEQISTSHSVPLFRMFLSPIDESETVFLVNFEGIVLKVHENIFQTIFGYTAEEAVGNSISFVSTSSKELSSELPKPSLSPKPALGSSGSGLILSPTLKNSPLNSPRISPHLDRPKWMRTGIHKDTIQTKDGSFFDIIVEITPKWDESGQRNLIGSIKRKMPIGFENKTRKTKIGEFEVGETLGKGTHGKVRLGISIKNRDQKSAIKSIKKAKLTPIDLERINREIQILKSLDHPNIVRLRDVIEDGETINIVMDYWPQNLRQYLKTFPKHQFPEYLCRDYFRQLLSAISYCHKNRVIHRDIKHENILLSADAKQLTLIDFGFSNYSEETQFRTTFCGSPAFCAPEMFMAQKYRGPEVDVWSLGVCLYSIAAGELPFDNVQAILDGSYSKPEFLSPDLLDLLSKMFQISPEKRATIQDVQNHNWVTSGPT